MNTSDQEHWWLVEAGEYVLGTLRGAERDLFEKVIDRDPEARSYVEYWERHFQAIDIALAQDDTITEVPNNIWPSIRAKIDEHSSGAEVTQPSSEDAAGTVVPMRPTGQATSQTTSQATPPQRRVAVAPPPAPTVYKDSPSSGTWAGITVAAMAASVFATVLAIKTQPQLIDEPIDVTTDVVASSQDADYNVLSVLSNESGEDLWTVLANADTGTVNVVGLQTPESTPDNSHQLWIILPDDTGVQSVGLLPYGEGSQQSFVLEDALLKANLAQGVAFAVSLEPAGGSPEAVPTGPVITSAAYTRIQ